MWSQSTSRVTTTFGAYAVVGRPGEGHDRAVGPPLGEGKRERIGAHLAHVDGSVAAWA